MALSLVDEISTRPLKDVVLGFDGASQLNLFRGLTEEVAGGDLYPRPFDVSNDTLQHPPIEMVERIEGVLRELDPVVDISDEELSAGVHIIKFLGHFHVLPLFSRDDTDLTMFVDERRDGLGNFLALHSQGAITFFFAAVEYRGRVSHDRR